MGAAADVPIFITVRDRLTDLLMLIGWLEHAGYTNLHLLDNDSTWPPLVYYLHETGHTVHWLHHNYGSQALWKTRLAPSDCRFVLTDPDVIPTEHCPINVLEHLAEVMDRHHVPKVGLGLYLDDVPANMPSLEWELGPEIRGPILDDTGARQSLVDTTFALYEPGTQHMLEAIRTGPPYEARHMGWYRTELDDEHRYYLRHAVHGPGGTTSWEGL